MIDKSMREKMRAEALEEMELLKIDSKYISFFKDGELFNKIVVDHENGIISSERYTEEEKNMIRNIEEENDKLIYYVISDDALWPDGEKFHRYTCLCVSPYEEDWSMVKEECIAQFGTVYAYVVNADDEGASEYCEIPFQNIQGTVINVS